MKRNKLKYWMFLLSENSQCADRWEEFSSIGWRDLLSAQPQFADKCNMGFTIRKPLGTILIALV